MNVLKVFSSFNLYGGTPTKILEIGRKSNLGIIYYLYERFAPMKDYVRFKSAFEFTNRRMLEAYFGWNVYKHLQLVLKTFRTKSSIKIVHSYFTFGEILGFLFKMALPETKWLVSFVSPDRPTVVKMFILKCIYQKLDGVIYISEYVRLEKERQFPKLSFIKSKVIYNGATLRKIESRIERKSVLELLTIGGLVGWKNIFLLLEVANALKEKGVSFHLTIIGDGPERSRFVRYIEENSLSSAVSLIGYTTNVGGHLDCCDIYLHPSLTEGFGIAVAEAMMFAKPIIVSDAGALPELIENNNNGFVLSSTCVTEWTDRIMLLSENRRMMENFGNKSFERALSIFSIDTFVKKHDEFYLEIGG